MFSLRVIANSSFAITPQNIWKSIYFKLRMLYKSTLRKGNVETSKKLQSGIETWKNVFVEIIHSSWVLFLFILGKLSKWHWESKQINVILITLFVSKFHTVMTKRKIHVHPVYRINMDKAK